MQRIWFATEPADAGLYPKRPMSESEQHIRPADYTWKDIVRIALGVVMFILGLLGLVFPILQGLLFLLISAILLAPYSRRVRQILNYGERRFPGIVARARQLKKRYFTSRA